MKAETLTTIERAFKSAPVEFQHLKQKSLSNTYQYYVEVYLRNVNISSSAGEVNRVVYNLWQGIFLDPASVLSKYTRSMIIKTLLIKVLSPKNANHLFQLIKRFKDSLGGYYQRLN